MLNGMISSVSGLVKSPATNVAIDSDAVFHTLAADNIAIGANSLDDISGDADNNVAIGVDAGTAVSTGSHNTFLGTQSGKGVTTHASNVAIGYQAMQGGGANRGMAIGVNALRDADYSGVDNIAIGYHSGYAIHAGTQNTAIGNYAMKNYEAAVDNVAIGYQAMDGYDSNVHTAASQQNVFVGSLAGSGNWQADAVSEKNVAIGYNALRGNLNAADQNVCVGYETGYAITTGEYNTLIGAHAGDAITVSKKNVAVGMSALGSFVDNEDHAEANNVAVGYEAMKLCDKSKYIIAIGAYAHMTATGKIQNNIAIGMESMKLLNHASAIDNIAIGHLAMDGVGALACASNVFIGSGSGGGSWTGTASNRNIGIGKDTFTGAMNAGDDNIAIGDSAGKLVTTGEKNIFMGTEAGGELTTASSNIAIGYHAMHDTSGFDGNDNIYIGAGTGDTAWTTASSGQNTIVGSYSARGAQNGATKNTGMGYAVLNALTEGDYNTVIGANSGDVIETGVENTILGYDAGDTITTGSWNICIGSLTDIGSSGGSGQIAVGRLAITQNDYETRIGYAGAFQFYSALQTIELSDGADATATHTNPVVKIPAGAVIKSVSAVVTVLSSRATSVLAIYMSDDTSRADGDTLTNGVEILGAGEATTTSYVSSSASDIVASSGGVLNASWYSEPKLNGLSAADRYVYICNAGLGNGSSNAGTDPKIRVCIEFAGQD